MALPAQTKYVFLTVLFILASVNFTRTALEIIENSRRLDNLSQEVDELETQKKELERSVTYKQTNEYIEEKARNDLNLIRPGEKVYVIPKELTEAAQNESVLGEDTISLSSKIGLDDENSHFVQWVNLFLQ